MTFGKAAMPGNRVGFPTMSASDIVTRKNEVPDAG